MSPRMQGSNMKGFITAKPTISSTDKRSTVTSGITVSIPYGDKRDRYAAVNG